MTARDPEATRARLLAAGLAEFSEKGVAGARVDAIADRARTNKRMLYYYFGSKEGLYREILRQRLLSTTEKLRQAAVADPVRMAQRGEQVPNHREYVRLLMWEALETDLASAVEDEPARRAFYEQWVGAIRTEQAAGRLPDGLDPAQLLLAEIGLTLFPAAFPQLTRLITGHGPDDREFLAERHRFLEELGRGLAEMATAPADRRAAPAIG